MKGSIRLTPHSEQLLEEQLARGPFRSPEEVIERALESLAQSQPSPSQDASPTRTPAQAIAEILEIQGRNRLVGLKIKDLIQEGRKY